MELNQFLPSVHFAISQLKDGSEDAQMHSFYLSKLAAALNTAVVESTPENRQDGIKYLWSHLKDNPPLLSIGYREDKAKAVSPEPTTVVVYGPVSEPVAYAIAHHFGCTELNLDASMIVTGKLNTVPERPKYDIEGVTILSVKHCIGLVGL